MKLPTPTAKFLVSVALQLLFKRGRKAGRDWLQLRGAEYYVKTVKGTRKAFIGLLAFFLVLMLLGGGFALLHVGLYLLLPEPANVIVMLALGAVYVIVGLLVLAKACSESLWLDASGANAFTEKALHDAARPT